MFFLSIHSSVGHEYEFYLCRELKERKINYFDEHDLRARGYDKTPDIKLDIPIGELYFLSLVRLLLS